MKNTRIIAYLVVALLIVIGIAFLGIKGCQKKNQTISDVSSIEENRQTPPKKYVDETGKNHAVKKVDIGSKEALQISYKKEYDSVIRLLGIKDKQIEAVTIVATKNSGTIKLLSDSLRGIKSYSGNNVSFSLTKEDSLHYTVYDSLYQTNYWKRNWFLGKKTHLIDAYSTNPNVEITNIEQARVRIVEPGRLGVGPAVSFGVGSDGKMRFVYGLSLHFSILRF